MTDQKVWEGGDETTPPDEALIKHLERDPNSITPETEAEEL